MKKIRVFVLFGGRSAEHEVSILSARNVFTALDRDRFEPVPVGIDKRGQWRLEPAATLLEAAGDPRKLALAGGGAALDPSGIGPDDVVFPVLHGTYGEDGTVQGLLDLVGVAYVGAGVLGSAIGMDKDVSKRLLRDAGIPIVDFRVITAADWARDRPGCVSRAQALGFPQFVKPANAGSSVGVTRVAAAGALEPAVDFALGYDRKVLCEHAVPDAREIECAVLGNDDAQASVPGEVIVSHRDGFYSYDAKYVDDGASFRIPADLPAAASDQVRRLSVAAFRVLELCGMARVDFLVERGSLKLALNEVNTIPGFTAISMYPKMWQASGLPLADLVSRLIELAIERRDARRTIRTESP